MSTSMKQRTIYILIILFLSSGLKVYSQSKNDILQYQNVFDKNKEADNYAFAKNNIHNEVYAVFSGLYLFYKYCISSQDMSVCVFYPSCSTYALQSIQKQGVFIGSLAAFDRLCRCNGFNLKNYPIHEGTGKAFDPVE